MENVEREMPSLNNVCVYARFNFLLALNGD